MECVLSQANCVTILLYIKFINKNYTKYLNLTKWFLTTKEKIPRELTLKKC